MKTIKIFLFISIQLVCCMTYAQSYNTELNTLGQYMQRMYMNEPFEGAKVISDVDKCYLVCLVAESATANEYATQRKAEVKAMRYANEYLNGTQISSNTIVYTKETSDGYSYEEIEDFIESRAMGYVQTMQVISTFTTDAGKKVFVYCKELPMPEKAKTKKGRKRK